MNGSIAIDGPGVQLPSEAALQLGQIGVWRHDLRTGLVHLNDIAAAALGCAPDQRSLLWSEMQARVNPKDLPQLNSACEKAALGVEPVAFEMRLRQTRQKAWQHVSTRCAVVRDAAGTPIAVHGVSVDLTAPLEDARRAQTMVRRLETIGQAAGMGFWAVRRGAQPAYWGPQLYAMHGLPPAESPPELRHWLREYVHPDDRAAVRRTLLSGLRAGSTPQETEFRLLRRDGKTLRVIAHTRVEQFDDETARPFGLLIDMTDRFHAQAALRKNAGRAQLIARAVGLGTWEHDLESDGAEWDEQMWRLRGLVPQAQAPDGAERRSYVHPEDRDITDWASQHGARVSVALEYEFRVVWPDGSVHWLASRSIAESDDEGRLIRRVGLNWDITKARNLRAAHEEKLTAQRELQAKSKFLSRMSHELRTPLNAVLGFTQLLQADEGRDDIRTRRQRLEQIRRAGQHLLELIDDVLDLSRLEGGEMAITLEAVSLPVLVESVLPLVEAQARDRDVRIRLGRLQSTAHADPTRLRQVLLNLLTNAIKYNRAGGEIYVDAQNSDGICLLRVRDTGHGLTAAQLQHLFEPFNRLGAERSEVPGTGIGLAIVKALVERMGGTVHVESSPDHGTCFELRLHDGASPALAPAGPSNVQMLALAAGRSGRRARGRILYIEDNPVNAMIVVELARLRADLELKTTENGSEGLELARSWQPDLILLDMQLPDMSGEQVFAALRADARCAQIPCIALSANALPTDIERALRAGFSDYWTKPLDFRLFHTAIETVFGPPRPPAAAPDSVARGSHG
jgi:signal transduction histidine kinase/ActR/RegA family two-component response regulator